MSNRSNRIIFWDWNGTLLDDVQVCVKSINHLLKKRNLPILDLTGYREVFTFPVRHYYEELGFDFTAETFEKPAREFMDIYIKNLEKTDLHIKAYETLQYFQSNGYKQYIISAMEHNMLTDLVQKFGIVGFFEKVIGITDIYANGKLHMAEMLYNSLNAKPEEIFFVGDTLHDYEVASHFGFQAVLLSHGHQSTGRLKSSGALVKNGFSELISVIDDHFGKNKKAV